MSAPRIDLSWQAPGDCPTQERVLEVIEQEHTLATATGDGPIRVDVIVHRTPEGWEADLQFLSGLPAGGRRLIDSSCDSLAHAVAFVIAVAAASSPSAIDAAPPLEPPPSPTTSTKAERQSPPLQAPTSRRRNEAAQAISPARPGSPVPAGEPPSPVPVPPNPLAVAPTSHNAAPPPVITDVGSASPASDASEVARESTSATRSKRRQLVLTMSGGLSAGRFALPIGLLSVGAGFEWKRLWMHANARYWTPTQVSVSSPAGADAGPIIARFTGATVTTRACPALRWGPIGVPLCAGAEAGAVFSRAEGDGVTPQPQRDIYLGLLAQAGVTVDIVPRLRLLATADASFALTRTRYTVGQVGELHRLGTLAGGGMLGLIVPL